MDILQAENKQLEVKWTKQLADEETCVYIISNIDMFMMMNDRI